LNRLTALLRRTSGGKWNIDHARPLLNAANEAMALWSGGGLDCTELAWDLASEVRIIRQLEADIGRLDTRIAELYADADPNKIVLSAPGVGPVLAGGSRGRLGDADPTHDSSIFQVEVDDPLIRSPLGDRLHLLHHGVGQCTTLRSPHEVRGTEEYKRCRADEHHHGPEHSPILPDELERLRGLTPCRTTCATHAGLAPLCQAVAR
jgi:hypothetical protein